MQEQNDIVEGRVEVDYSEAEKRALLHMSDEELDELDLSPRTPEGRALARMRQALSGNRKERRAFLAQMRRALKKQKRAASRA